MKLRCVYFKLAAFLLVLTLLLAGCGGGTSDIPDADVPRVIVVVPSLGKITGATVNVYQADNSTLLVSGALESSGKAQLIFDSYTGPVVIEVVGNNTAQYFDEASNTYLAFGADKKMRAIAPSEIGAYAVTMLTELAYQRALSSNAFPLQAANVNAINESIRKATITEIENILTAPFLFDENTTSNSLSDDDEGRYALKLAALAKLGEGDATPALSIMGTLIKDIEDDVIDGKDESDSSFIAPYSDFKTELDAKLIETANSFGNDDLKAEIPNYPPIHSSPIELDVTPPTVTSVSPVDEATGVSVNTTITATFSEAIKLETINETNFTVSGATGAVSYNTTNNTATFTPSAPLAPDTTYTATIISNVQDLAGNTLEVTEWGFMTGEVTTISEGDPFVLSGLGNNSALLSGSMLGNGTTANSLLRKPLKVTVLDSSTPVLMVGSAYVVRESTDEIEFDSVILPVTNSGNELLCFVKITDIVFRNNAGDKIKSQSATYVQGSVGKSTSSGIFTDTCLAPGETGILTTFFYAPGFFSSVDKIELTISEPNMNFVIATSRVIPQNYAVQASNRVLSSNASQLDVTVKNVGSSNATLDTSRWYLFDDTMLPLDWGVLHTPDDQNVVLPSDATTTLSNTFVNYDGAGTKLLVFIDFEDQDQALSKTLAKPSLQQIDAANLCNGKLSPEERMVCWHNARNKRIEEQRIK